MQGARLNNGSRGVLMSLPELACMNIRKGRYKFVLPEPHKILARLGCPALDSPLRRDND